MSSPSALSWAWLARALSGLGCCSRRLNWHVSMLFWVLAWLASLPPYGFPALSAFARRYPEVELQLHLTDRPISLPDEASCFQSHRSTISAASGVGGAEVPQYFS